MKNSKERTTVYIDKDLHELASSSDDMNMSHICNSAFAAVLRDGVSIDLAKARKKLNEHLANVGALKRHISDLEKVQAEKNDREAREQGRKDKLAKTAEIKRLDPANAEQDNRLTERRKILKLRDAV